MVKIVASVRRGDRRLTQSVASWESPWARRVLPAAQEAAEHTKLWWAAAAVMSAAGGRRGRYAAGAGLAAVGVAELLSDVIAKRLVERRRPPKEWIPHQEVNERPASSSFPSGHTAAGVAFAAAVMPVWPWAGAVCAVPAGMVAVGRVHSGAHYPTDVVAGTAIGLIAATLVHWPLRPNTSWR